MMPRKLASSMKAIAASKPSMLPKKSPAVRERRPVCAELEFEGDACDYADGYIKKKDGSPEAGVYVVVAVFSDEPEASTMKRKMPRPMTHTGHSMWNIVVRANWSRDR